MQTSSKRKLYALYHVYHVYRMYRVYHVYGFISFASGCLLFIVITAAAYLATSLSLALLCRPA